MRGNLVAMLLLFGCATGRTYKTDLFEMKVGEGTQVEEERPPKGREWRFSDERGAQFLGASQYRVAGDPTFPCGIPEVQINGAPAFYVRRTLRTSHYQSQPTVTSVIFEQEDGTVLEFSYEETSKAAREMVARIDIRHPRKTRSSPCEALRSGGALDGDTYDAKFFTVKLLTGTWLLDLGHFRSTDREGGPWRFQEADTGRIFLTASQNLADLQAPCLQGAVVRINGAAAFRVSDTDNLEPYPGSSNVRITFLQQPPRGRYRLVQFFYDEHSPTARLAEMTLETLRVRDPIPLDPACVRPRTE